MYPLLLLLTKSTYLQQISTSEMTLLFYTNTICMFYIIFREICILLFCKRNPVKYDNALRCVLIPWIEATRELVLLTKTTAAQNEVAFSYRKVRELYFLAATTAMIGLSNVHITNARAYNRRTCI